MSVLKIKKQDTGEWLSVLGPIGPQGPQGNGINSAVLNDDYTLTITFTDGTSYTTPSIRGARGEQGVSGYTPVREIDYWTSEDQTAISNEINIELAKRSQLKPEFANSVEECTDTSKLYVFPDGNIYAYMTKETYTEAPELWKKENAKLNYRVSGTTEVSANGYYLTELIRADTSLSDPLILRFKNGALFSGSGDKIVFYREDGTLIKTSYIYTSRTASGSNFVHLAEKDGSDYIIKIGYGYQATSAESIPAVFSKIDCYDEIHWIKINQQLTTNSAITIDSLPDCNLTIDAMGGTKTETSWMNTGHAFVPTDYEDRIIEVEQQLAENTQKLAVINNGNTVTVPDYWQDSVASVISAVKTLQDEGGKDVVNFVWFSDMHHATGTKHTQNIGSLCAKIMDECNIPFTISSGDTASAGVASSENQFLGWLNDAMSVLSPISPDRLLIARGNHDDVYGSNNGVDYVNKASSKKVWNILHRPQSMDFRRVYGPEGTYFYLDNIPQKTRFIVLDCHRCDSDGYTDGTEGAMTSGYGQTQMDWFAKEALPKDKPDWSIVIIQHVPPTAKAVNGVTRYLSDIAGGEVFRGIVTAYCNKTNYSGNYSGTQFQTVDISVDYTNTQTSEVIGIFCGHCHADAYVTGDLPCPIITITCAINTPYDAEWDTRVFGTTTETALDVVSINKATGVISTTRLGYGNDRVIPYK